MLTFPRTRLSSPFIGPQRSLPSVVRVFDPNWHVHPYYFGVVAQVQFLPSLIETDSTLAAMICAFLALGTYAQLYTRPTLSAVSKV